MTFPDTPTTSPSPAAVRRAAILLVVIAAELLLALPIGPKVTAKSIATPAAQREVDVWMELAGPLGFTREGFEDTVVTWSDRLVEADKAITAPIKPFSRFTRTGQGWALFAGSDRTPQVFEVLGVSEDGDERFLFRRLDPRYTWGARWFRFRRVRGVYDIGSRKSLPPRYTNMVDWIAARAFEDHPDLVKVIVQQTEIHTTRPYEAPDPTTRTLHRRVVVREEP